ncbi:HIRAN domain-containing protein [Macrococcus caseolyticus]|uniref:HIRAN domain-containing protein n=1 Tax=Macrococcoides caseolyticum TaxID=69966 RepID=UPI0024BC13D1|nr:HIRAN domain-containing protein [Macrococcus caseolyticus]MDJ1156090.1 HIRAN domain-containing protein [Macrococcus caseolyticus]
MKEKNSREEFYFNLFGKNLIAKSSKDEEINKLTIQIIDKKSQHSAKKLMQELNIRHYVTSSKQKVHRLKQYISSPLLEKYIEDSDDKSVFIYEDFKFSIYDYKDDVKKWERHFELKSKIVVLSQSSCTPLGKLKEIYSDIKTNERVSYIFFENSQLEVVITLLKQIDYEKIIFDYYDVDDPIFYDDKLVLLTIYDGYSSRVNWSNKVMNKFNSNGIHYGGYDDSNGTITYFERYPSQDRGREYFRQDLGNNFKSSMESNLARLFNYLGLKWEYEKERIHLDNISYLPDFIIQDTIVVEAKGFWDELSLKRVYEYSHMKEKSNFYIIDYDMYYTLNNIYAEKIENWEKTKVSLPSNLIPVVGITRKERKDVVSDLLTGDQVKLKRDKENNFDKNAVLVLDVNDRIVGYISKEWAAVYASKLDIGMKYNCIIKEINSKVIYIKVKRDNKHEKIIFEFLHKH